LETFAVHGAWNLYPLDPPVVLVSSRKSEKQVAQDRTQSRKRKLPGEKQQH